MSIESNPIYRQFQIAEQILRGTFENRNPIGSVFTGPPGFGKSRLIRALCQRYGQKWQPIRSSASQLMQIISERRNGLLVFDGFDKVFADAQMLEVFKIVLDSHEERVLSHDVRGRTKSSRSG